MKPKAGQNEISGSRRTFLKWLWAGLGFIASIEIFVIILSFFKSEPKGIRKNKAGTDGIIEVGSFDQFPPETVTAFVMGRFYLVHLASGGFLAISSQCTHLGCSIPWDKIEQKFLCPCHASQFDITGKVLSSPAPRALDLYKISIHNRKIVVNTTTKIRRNSFNPNQLAFPDEIKITGIQS